MPSPARLRARMVGIRIVKRAIRYASGLSTHAEITIIVVNSKNVCGVSKTGPVVNFVLTLRQGDTWLDVSRASTR